MPSGVHQHLSLQRSAVSCLFILLALTPPMMLSAMQPAFALSEIKREEIPPPGETAKPGDTTPPTAQPAPNVEVPLPDPMSPAAPADDDETPADEEPGTAPAEGGIPGVTPDEEGGIARPNVDPNAPLPEVVYDLAKLPEPVKRMHNLLVEACKTGDIEKLRPLLGTGTRAVQLSLTENADDPITFLKNASGDSAGQEILAIMEEVLNAGYVHLGAGRPEEIYAWPYFFGLPLDKLTARQRVELFKIITAGDYEEMITFNTYIFYRLGITPSGEWAFFVTGE